MMNHVVRRLIAVVAALTLIVVFAPIQSSTASGAGALTINELWCEGTGGGRLICDVSASGGSGSYTYTWKAISNAGGVSTSTVSWATGTCRIGYNATVGVTVKDSTGAAVYAQDTFRCYQIAP